MNFDYCSSYSFCSFKFAIAKLSLLIFLYWFISLHGSVLNFTTYKGIALSTIAFAIDERAITLESEIKRRTYSNKESKDD